MRGMDTKLAIAAARARSRRGRPGKPIPPSGQHHFCPGRPGSQDLAPSGPGARTQENTLLNKRAHPLIETRHPGATTRVN